MAKETKAPTSETPAKETKAAPKEAVERGGTDIFRAVIKDGKPVEPEKKLAPQAQTIINTIRAAGKEGVSRDALVKNLKGVLVTRQPEGRIVSYYQKAMIASGAIVMEKGSAPAAPAPAAK